MMYYNNKRLALIVFWIVLGAVLVVLTVTEVLDSSIYSGMGGALMAVGTLQLIRAIKYRKDSEYREKVDTELGDERNRFLRMKSWSWAGYLTILIEGIGAIIAMVLGERTVQLVLSYSVWMVLVIYWIAYVILSKKY